MQIQENITLAPYTTFHIGGPAKFFCSVQTVEELRQALEWAQSKHELVLVLGGGSNMLINDRGFNGLVIHIQLPGLRIISENETVVHLGIGAGEIWDKVVAYAVDHGWWGIENLSHIPGSAGAIAVQNVGAYGQEASQVLDSVNVFDRQDNQVKQLTVADCRLTYRHSIFNTTEKGRYVIISVVIKLFKQGQPNLSYGDVKKYFDELHIANPTQAQVRQAIIEIRNTKFPFPDRPEHGNAGSFFRGRHLSTEEFEQLRQRLHTQFGDAALQRLDAMTDRLRIPQGYKLPYGFLLELCGVKGLRQGDAIINPQHPVIIINSTGRAKAQDVLDLANQVVALVKQKTGLELEFEPVIISYES